MSEGLTDSTLPFGGNLDLENTKLLLEVLEIQPSQWLHHTSATYSSIATY